MDYLNLEDIPGYAGIFGEVAVMDCYHLRQLDYKPNLIFDLGANIGAFTRHAARLFPNAEIVSVEPNPWNYQYLTRFTNGPNHSFVEAAIGRDKIWHYTNAPSIGHHCYISPGLGYPEDRLESEENKLVEAVAVPLMTLPELAARFPLDGKDVFLKMDIEGNEHTVFTDPDSMAVLRQCKGFAVEVHKYALTHELIEEVQSKTDEALLGLGDEFDIHWEHVVFYGRKRD